jgi:hypothetical protein
MPQHACLNAFRKILSLSMADSAMAGSLMLLRRLFRTRDKYHPLFGVPFLPKHDSWFMLPTGDF